MFYFRTVASYLQCIQQEISSRCTNGKISATDVVGNRVKTYASNLCVRGNYTLFHEKKFVFFSNIIGLPEHRNKRKSILEITKMYHFKFSFQPVLHDWCNKGHGMCYPVCGMVHIKEPLLLIDKCSLCGGSGFPFSLSEWSLTICLTPYNRR